jgi:hypothetical protein
MFDFHRFIILIPYSVVFEFHRKQFIVSQSSFPLFIHEKIINSWVLIARFLVAATGRCVVRVKLICARPDTNVCVAPNQVVIIVSDRLRVHICEPIRWFSLHSESLLIFQTENVTLLVLNVCPRHEGWLRISCDYLAVLNLNKQNNKWVTVNISMERLLVPAVKPIKRFCQTDCSSDIFFKIFNEPFEVFSIRVVKDVSVEVLKVFTGRVFGYLLVTFGYFIFLYFGLFKLFGQILNFWLEGLANFIVKLIDCLCFLVNFSECILKATFFCIELVIFSFELVLNIILISS